MAWVQKKLSTQLGDGKIDKRDKRKMEAIQTDGRRRRRRDKRGFCVTEFKMGLTQKREGQKYSQDPVDLLDSDSLNFFRQGPQTRNKVSCPET